MKGDAEQEDAPVNEGALMKPGMKHLTACAIGTVLLMLAVKFTRRLTARFAFAGIVQ